MRVRWMILAFVGATSALIDRGATAASYLKTDGTVVDPIRHLSGNVLDYFGPNLVPLSNLANSVLRNADLAEANLQGAELQFSDFLGSSLAGADLSEADLYRAILTDTNLSSANLTNADLAGANLSSANLHNSTLTNSYYNEHTRLPPGFDPISAGMTSGPRIINNGLAPPVASNIIQRDDMDYLIDNFGCNSQAQHPCFDPGVATTVSGAGRVVSIYGTSAFEGSGQIVNSYDASTTLLNGVLSDFFAFDSSTMTIVQCSYCTVAARGSSTVFANGHFEGTPYAITASDRSHVVFSGGTDEAEIVSVEDRALLEMSGSSPYLVVSGGRVVLTGGVESGLWVGPPGVLEITEGSIRGVGFSGGGVTIAGKLFFSGGEVGPGEIDISGYASVSGGRVFSSYEFHPGPNYFDHGPWNFSSSGLGIIEISGGRFDDSDLADTGWTATRLGARDDSRIRLFGGEFAVDGISSPLGSLEPQSGVLTGTLRSGDLLGNEFAHRGADCGGQPCTGRILVLSPGIDWDQDTVPNPFDNCAEEPNFDQSDLDANGTGDVCFSPVDLDRDTVIDALDNCRVDANSDQLDSDADGVGDACEKDLVFWADQGLEGCSVPPKKLPYLAVTTDLANDEVIDRSEQPCNCFGIEYPATAGSASVRFVHRLPSGAVNDFCENVAPFALGLGPNQSICAGSLSEDGIHELMLTPYDAPGCEAGGGNALPSSIRNFTMETPEPGIAVMVGVGALSLAGLTRRRSVTRR